MNQWFARNRWWVLRILQLPIDLFVFATLAFFFVRLIPGDPAAASLAASGGQATASDLEALRERMGLGGSLMDQLLRFWGGLLTGNMGTSIASGHSVQSEVWSRLPGTLELVGIGMVGAAVCAFLLGFLYTKFAAGWLRRLIRMYSGLAQSIPVFVVAVFGIVLFFLVWQIAPAPLGRTATGEIPVITNFPLLDALISGQIGLFFDVLAHYIMPVAAIILTYTPNLLTQLISGLDREVGQLTTRFQVAAGTARPWIFFSVFRRSLSSVVVVFGQLFGALLGGAVTLEQLFGFGGIGQLAVRSVSTVDFPTLQGFLVNVAAVCLVVYFAVDVVNMWLDPRRRPGVSIS
jgi:peptide/nickel transport system permease protein